LSPSHHFNHLSITTPQPAHPPPLPYTTLFRSRDIIRKTENVGPRFAEEARRIHEGDADDRPIRGTATAEERLALSEDGIDVMARSEEHTSELQSRENLVCRLLLEKKNTKRPQK